METGIVIIWCYEWNTGRMRGLLNFQGHETQVTILNKPETGQAVVVIAFYKEWIEAVDLDYESRVIADMLHKSDMEFISLISKRPGELLAKVKVDTARVYESH